MISEFFNDERVVKLEISKYQGEKDFTLCIQGDLGGCFNLKDEEKMNFFYVKGDTPEEALKNALEKLKTV